MNKITLLAVGGLVLTNLFWAGNTLFARAFSENISSYDLNLLRWAVALLIITPVAMPYIKKDWHLFKMYAKKILLLGILSVTCFNFLLYQAAHFTQAINIGLINTLVPVFILLLAWPILKKKPTPISFLCIAVGIAGALIIIFKGNFKDIQSFYLYSGDFIMMIAASLWAIYSVLLNKWHIKLHPLSLLWSMITVGLLVLLILMPIFGVPKIPEIGSNLSYVVIYMAIFPAILAYLFWNYGVSKVGVSISSIFVYLNPCFTALIGVLIGQENIQNYHLMGGLLILIALLMTSLSHSKKLHE